jgi:hypothetical protein
MKWQTIVVGLIALPILALFGGIGFLAYQIGQTWDARSTDSLIAGLVATCGGGVVVIGILLALIVGIPFAIRMFGEAGYSQRAWRELPSTPPFPALTERPPRLVDTTWQTLPAPAVAPPWGMTGGGNIGLLPAPNQDKRFGMAASQMNDLEELKRAWGEQ